MKRALLILLCLTMASWVAMAQLLFVPFSPAEEGKTPVASPELADSLRIIADADSLAALDSSLFIVDKDFEGRRIFDIMPVKWRGDVANVNIQQPAAVRYAIEERYSAAPSGELTGYRVRIYFSNSQNAREESVAARERFKARFPEYRAYRSYVNPNFKVTVGNFRTKSEALALLNDLKGMFPAAFVVREKIDYYY